MLGTCRGLVASGGLGKVFSTLRVEGQMLGFGSAHACHTGTVAGMQYGTEGHRATGARLPVYQQGMVFSA